MRDIVYFFLKDRFDPYMVDLVFNDFYDANKIWIEHDFMVGDLLSKQILIAKYWHFIKDFVPF